MSYFQGFSKAFKKPLCDICSIFAADSRLYNFHYGATFTKEQNTLRIFFVPFSLPSADKTARHMVPREQQNSSLAARD